MAMSHGQQRKTFSLLHQIVNYNNVLVLSGVKIKIETNKDYYLR